MNAYLSVDHETTIKFMRQLMPATDFRHWLSDKLFVLGENPAHHFCDTAPCGRFSDKEHYNQPSGYVQVTGWNNLIPQQWFVD